MSKWKWWSQRWARNASKQASERTDHHTARVRIPHGHPFHFPALIPVWAILRTHFNLHVAKVSSPALTCSKPAILYINQYTPTWTGPERISLGSSHSCRGDQSARRFYLHLHMPCRTCPEQEAVPVDGDALVDRCDWSPPSAIRRQPTRPAGFSVLVISAHEVNISCRKRT